MAEWKEVIKPPFANYDLVVYFGCSLFALPLIYHYVTEPLGLRFPRFQFHIGNAFADTAISTLSLLFAVYLLGHIIAYVSSAFIERTADLVFGKVSSSILIAHFSDTEEFNETIQGWIAKRIKNTWNTCSRPTLILKILFYVPVMPALGIMFGMRWFDYFRTRIPLRVFAQIRLESERRGYGPVTLHTQWYKAVEHDVINNHPIATARMYNYLVISGLFRSLTFLFICCAWGELYYLMHMLSDGHYFPKALMAQTPSVGLSLTILAVFNVISVFALSAYIKFARRYVEEALFAFVLARPMQFEPTVGLP